eukprot:1916705-Pyramimonas_sp.AAC.1
MDQPVRTPCGVEKTPRLPCSGQLSRIAAALMDHPVRTPCGVKETPRLLCPGRTDSGRAQGLPRAHLVWCRETPRLQCRGRLSRIAV